jgi:hypothetical protein
MNQKIQIVEKKKHCPYLPPSASQGAWPDWSDGRAPTQQKQLKRPLFLAVLGVPRLLGDRDPRQREKLDHGQPRSQEGDHFLLLLL